MKRVRHFTYNKALKSDSLHRRCFALLRRFRFPTQLRCSGCRLAWRYVPVFSGFFGYNEVENEAPFLHSTSNDCHTKMPSPKIRLAPSLLAQSLLACAISSLLTPTLPQPAHNKALNATAKTQLRLSVFMVFLPLLSVEFFGRTLARR